MDFILIPILVVFIIFLSILYKNRVKWILDKDKVIYDKLCETFEKRGFQVLKLDIIGEQELKNINSKYSNKTSLIIFYNINFYKKILLKKDSKVINLVVRIVRSPFYTYKINILGNGKSK